MEQTQNNPQAPTEEEKKQQQRDVAAFAYFLVLSPVLLFTRKDSSFIQFHAKQATALFIVAVFFALLPTPFSYLNFFVVALALTGFMQANMGKEWRMPIIANIIETGISADVVWGYVVRFFQTIKSVFTSSPKKTIQGASDLVAKARGIDTLKLNEMLQEEKRARQALEKKVETLEEQLKEKYSAK